MHEDDDLLFALDFMTYHCPFCGEPIKFFRADDVECSCGELFWVDFYPTEQLFRFWKDGQELTPEMYRY